MERGNSARARGNISTKVGAALLVPISAAALTACGLSQEDQQTVASNYAQASQNYDTAGQNFETAQTDFAQASQLSQQAGECALASINILYKAGGQPEITVLPTGDPEAIESDAVSAIPTELQASASDSAESIFAKAVTALGNRAKVQQASALPDALTATDDAAAAVSQDAPNTSFTAPTLDTKPEDKYSGQDKDKAAAALADSTTQLAASESAMQDAESRLQTATSAQDTACNTLQNGLEETDTTPQTDKLANPQNPDPLVQVYKTADGKLSLDPTKGAVPITIFQTEQMIYTGSDNSNLSLWDYIEGDKMTGDIYYSSSYFATDRSDWPNIWDGGTGGNNLDGLTNQQIKDMMSSLGVNDPNRALWVYTGYGGLEEADLTDQLAAQGIPSGNKVGNDGWYYQIYTVSAGKDGKNYLKTTFWYIDKSTNQAKPVDFSKLLEIAGEVD